MPFPKVYVYKEGILLSTLAKVVSFMRNHVDWVCIYYFRHLSYSSFGGIVAGWIHVTELHRGLARAIFHLEDYPKLGYK